MDAQSVLSAVLASSMHEIKNNLGVLFARIDRLIEPMELAAEQKSDLNQIKSLGETLNHELVRVLLLYKSNIGGYNPQIDQYSLADLFDDAIARHRITAETESLQIKNCCDDNCMGFFDESLLSSVLDTAIFNSAKAGASEIQLNARDENSMLVISIEDNGPGFPESILNAELMPKTRNGNGTGLGLYFAQTIAALHENNGKNGFIRLSNRSGHTGARMEICLP